MAPPPDLIQKKISNAFFSDDLQAKMGMSFGGLGLLILDAAAGGLWLGGNTYLTSSQLIFELNTLNRLFHWGKYRVEIPLVDISQVTIEPSVGFKIIQLTIPQGDFKIRVKGAKEFAALIEETIAKAKSGKG